MFNTMSEEELVSELLSLDFNDGRVGFTHVDKRDVSLLLPIINKYTLSKQLEARLDELTHVFRIVDGRTFLQSGISLAMPLDDRIAELRKQQEELR